MGTSFLQNILGNGSRQGPIAGFNYDTLPRQPKKEALGEQDASDYADWLSQGGGFQGLQDPGPTSSMSRDQMLEHFMEQHKNPRDAWRAAVNMRGQENPAFRPQALADVEHNLWARYFGSKGLPQGIIGLGGPFVYSAMKGLKQGLGMERGAGESVPTLTQLQQGQQGANQAFLDQLRQLF